MKKSINNVLVAMMVIFSSNLGLVACSPNKEKVTEKTYSNFYVLGDSLSDTGAGTLAQNQYLEHSNGTFKHFQLAKPYYNNSWSNDKVAAQLIAEKFNIKFKPAWWFKINKKVYQNYGNNYAFGGEVADSSDSNKMVKTFDLKSQTQMLLKQHQLQKKDLIWIEIGANDIGSLMTKKDVNFIKNKINKIITTEKQTLLALIKNGAKQIIISDVPDLTLTPKIKKILNNNQEKIRAARKICFFYQKAWKEMIKKMQCDYPNIIIPFFLSQELANDMIMFTKVIPNGVVATSATSCQMIINKTSYIYKPVFNKNVNENNLRQYFYFDEFHPAMWFHQQMAYHIINILQNK